MKKTPAPTTTKTKHKKKGEIDKRIEQFRKEIGDRPLTAEQQRIYNIFTRTRGKAAKVKVNDSTGNEITITFDPTKTDDGPQHVLTKHYKGKIGRVTAVEILNLLEIIKKGRLTSSDTTHIDYSLKKKINGVTYTFGIKIGKKEKYFKTFYSNRKKA